MEEQAGVEAELSEEQLQAITGGCRDCSGDARLVTRHTNKARIMIRFPLFVLAKCGKKSSVRLKRKEH